MKIEIVVKNYKLEEEVAEFLEKKISKLDRFFEKDTNCRVYLKVEKKLSKVEIEFSYQKTTIRAEEKGENFLDAINLILPKLERQIVKQRTKLESKLKKGAFDFADEVKSDDDDLFKLVKTKQFEINPQSVEDAISEFQLRGYNFYVFLDEKDVRIKVLYLRDDGNIAMIDPIITK